MKSAAILSVFCNFFGMCQQITTREWRPRPTPRLCCQREQTRPARCGRVPCPRAHSCTTIGNRRLSVGLSWSCVAESGDPISRVPSWRIVAPEPAAELLRYYRKAAVATGIDWEVLAAVNLVETGMGRIDGLSVANAQGPMQFLPSTWAERGIGEGDIRDPHDAIQAAARYLVRRGGLKDIRRGLWGYNNSRHYGEAVLQYAQLLKEDPQAFRGLYHWEILIATSAGDLWLPVGYQQARPLAVETYLQQVPVSRPAQP